MYHPARQPEQAPRMRRQIPRIYGLPPARRCRKATWVRGAHRDVGMLALTPAADSKVCATDLAEEAYASGEFFQFRAFSIACLRGLADGRSCSQRVVSMWSCSARAGRRRVCHSAWLARVEVLRSEVR